MSTFTNWNGPEGSCINSVRASDLLALTKEYTTLLTKLEEHITSGMTSTSVHKSDEFHATISNEIADAIQGLKNTYVTLEQLKDYPTAENIAAVYATLEDLKLYTPTSELADTYAKLVGNTANIFEPEAAFRNKVTFDNDVVFKSEVNFSEFKAEVLSTLIILAEQYNLKFKSYEATPSGTGEVGSNVYYILGMLGDRVGTAYLKYTDTTSFTAIVDFVTTAELDAEGNLTDYTNGQLSIITDAKGSGLSDLKFKLVKGTSEGKQHVYLAIESTNWLNNIDQGAIGLFKGLPFEGAGINFIPINSTGYVAPTGVTTVLSTIDYYAIEDRIDKLEEQISPLLDQASTIGSIVMWGQLNDEGVPVNLPEGYHICDGSAIDDDELKMKLNMSNYPDIDYFIIKTKE